MTSSASAAAILVLVAIVYEEVLGISVPTGKLGPITPAKVTPRPTYHPPTALAAPVQEYTYDNPEPALLDPSWVPVPPKYLHVLRPNSVVYIPIRIPNPAAYQHNYFNMAPYKQQLAQTTEATTYQTPRPIVVAAYQPQQNAAVQQTQQPNTAVYQNQNTSPITFQNQQENVAVQQPQQTNAAVYQSQQPAVYQSQQPAVYQNQQPAVYQTQQPAVYQTQQPAVQEQKSATFDNQKETDNTIYQKEQVQEFGAKISPKQKYKPYYYLPKSQYKQATKGGYPKKAVAAPSQKYYFYYPIPTNAQ